MISVLSQSQTHHLFTNSINCRIHQQRFKCLLLQLGGGALHYAIACEFLIFIGALFAYIYIFTYNIYICKNNK